MDQSAYSTHLRKISPENSVGGGSVRERFMARPEGSELDLICFDTARVPLARRFIPDSSDST